MPGQRRGKLELVVGALYINAGNSHRNLGMAQNLIDAARDYIETECVGFNEVVVYATIFSEAGKRWAKLSEFTQVLAGKNRGVAGGGHDVYRWSLFPKGANRGPTDRSAHIACTYSSSTAEWRMPPHPVHCER